MPRITAKQQYWSEHLLRAEAFEGTLSQYAQAHNIAVQTLYRWRHYLKSTASVERDSTPVFTQIVRAPVIQAIDYCISLQQGNTKIGFAQWPDPQWLSLLVEQGLALNPFEPALFVFVNRRKDKIKILYWEKNGFCLWYKRLEKHRFKWPSDHLVSTLTLTGEELNWLLDGFDLWCNKPHDSLHFSAVG